MARGVADTGGMMLAAIPFPNIDPVLVEIPLGPVSLAIHWYALAYIAGLLIAWRIVAATMARPALWGGQPPMEPARAEDLLTWMILGVVLGGRLGYVLFYQPAHYLAHPLEIVKVWEGGMSFHGGFLGVVIGAWAFCLRHRLPVLRVGDAVAVATPPGLLLGRLANFINAELWGRPTTLPWGVEFPNAPCPPEWLLPCTRHPSQLYEAGLEGLALGAILLWGAFRGGWLQVPGRAMGVFMAGYGLARFAVEFVRVPDPQFITAENPLGHALQFGPGLGLTMGQLLSLPMIAAGLWLAARRRRAGVLP